MNLDGDAKPATDELYKLQNLTSQRDPKRFKDLTELGKARCIR